MKLKFFLAIIFCSISFTTLTAQTTGDPWIYQVYKEMWGRQPNAWELNINNYNGGSWNNYGELKKHIQEYQSSFGLKVSVAPTANKTSVAAFFENGKQIAATLISNDAGRLISKDGAGIIGNDAAGLIGNDGSTLKNGSTLIGNDGSTIKLISNMPGVSFGSMYGGLAVGTKRIKTSGKGSLIIRK